MATEHEAKVGVLLGLEKAPHEEDDSDEEEDATAEDGMEEDGNPESYEGTDG
jgi:hypothetical protein